MIAAGVAIGFIGWFFAMLGGFAVNARDGGAGFFLILTSFVLLVASYSMVTP